MNRLIPILNKLAPIVGALLCLGTFVALIADLLLLPVVFRWYGGLGGQRVQLEQVEQTAPEVLAGVAAESAQA